MINGLLDFGGNGDLGGYAGGGVGYANVKQFGDSNGKLAWQLIAGIYAPVSPNIDIGLKYRYFRAGLEQRSKRSRSPERRCGPVGARCACSPGVVTFATTASSARTACWRAWCTTSAQLQRRRRRRLRLRRRRRRRGSGDADLPGRIGDPGDERLPGSAAAASAAAGERGERGR